MKQIIIVIIFALNTKFCSAQDYYISGSASIYTLAFPPIPIIRKAETTDIFIPFNTGVTIEKEIYNPKQTLNIGCIYSYNSSLHYLTIPFFIKFLSQNKWKRSFKIGIFESILIYNKYVENINEAQANKGYFGLICGVGLEKEITNKLILMFSYNINIGITPISSEPIYNHGALIGWQDYKWSYGNFNIGIKYKIFKIMKSLK